MRTAEAHWETEALVRAEHHVSTPLAGRRYQGEAHQVRGDTHLHALLFPYLNILTIVDNATILVRILDQDAEILLTCREVLYVINNNFYSEEVSPCLDNLYSLREHVVSNENLVHASLDLRTGAFMVEHYHCLCSRGGLIKQRRVRKRHRCQIANDSLEIKQSLKTSL